MFFIKLLYAFVFKIIKNIVSLYNLIKFEFCYFFFNYINYFLIISRNHSLKGNNFKITIGILIIFKSHKVSLFRHGYSYYHKIITYFCCSNKLKYNF